MQGRIAMCVPPHCIGRWREEEGRKDVRGPCAFNAPSRQDVSLACCSLGLEAQGTTTTHRTSRPKRGGTGASPFESPARLVRSNIVTWATPLGAQSEPPNAALLYHKGAIRPRPNLNKRDPHRGVPSPYPDGLFTPDHQ